MMRLASRARSRQVVRCSGSGQPVELRKVDEVRPISRAFSFIASANCCSEPEIASANTTQASLPDCTMTPRISASTGTVVPIWTNILLPPMRQARSLTGSSASSFSRPCFSMSKTMYMVISFDMEDGGIRSSAFFSSSTASVS